MQTFIYLNILKELQCLLLLSILSKLLKILNKNCSSFYNLFHKLISFLLLAIITKFNILHMIKYYFNLQLQYIRMLYIDFTKI